MFINDNGSIRLFSLSRKMHTFGGGFFAGFAEQEWHLLVTFAHLISMSRREKLIHLSWTTVTKVHGLL